MRSNLQRRLSLQKVMNHVIPVIYWLFDISVRIWTFFHRNLIPSVTFPSNSTLVPCWFWLIPFSKSHFFQGRLARRVCSFSPHHLASNLHIFVLSHLGVARRNFRLLLLVTEQLFFLLLWEVFCLHVGDINDVESFTYLFSPAEIFLAEAIDWEPSQTFGRTAVPEQVLAAEMGNQIRVSSQRYGLALEINRL